MIISIVLDANVPISLGSYKIDMLDEFLTFSQRNNLKLIMEPVNFYECRDHTIQEKLNRAPCFSKRPVNEEAFNHIKGRCKAMCEQYIQDNDYRVIAVARTEMADYIATNDRGLIKVAKEYKEGEGIPADQMVLIPPAGLVSIKICATRMRKWWPSI